MANVTDSIMRKLLNPQPAHRTVPLPLRVVDAPSVMPRYLWLEERARELICVISEQVHTPPMTDKELRKIEGWWEELYQVLAEMVEEGRKR